MSLITVLKVQIKQVLNCDITSSIPEIRILFRLSEAGVCSHRDFEDFAITRWVALEILMVTVLVDHMLQ